MDSAAKLHERDRSTAERRSNLEEGERAEMDDVISVFRLWTLHARLIQRGRWIIWWVTCGGTEYLSSEVVHLVRVSAFHFINESQL